MVDSSNTVWLNREAILTTPKQNDSDDELFSSATVFNQHVIHSSKDEQINFFFLFKFAVNVSKNNLGKLKIHGNFYHSKTTQKMSRNKPWVVTWLLFIVFSLGVRFHNNHNYYNLLERMWLIHKLLYFAIIILQNCTRTV